MNKKYLLLLCSILLLILIVGILYFSKESVGIECSSLTEKSLNKIYKTYTAAEDDLLPNLLFNGQELAYNASSATYYLPLSLSSDEWETGSFSTSAVDITIAFIDSFQKKDKLECINDNESFRFLVYNDQQYKEYNLVFTGLPTMTITSKGAVDSERILADFTVFDNSDVNNAITSSEGYLKLRGATSLSYPKYSYSIDLIKESEEGIYENNDVSFLGMREDNDWILSSLYNDDTKIRSMLSANLWNEMGADTVDSSAFYGFHIQYVEVFLNSQYIGLYALLEPVDYKQLNLKLTKGEYLYKRSLGSVLSADSFDTESGTSSSEDDTLSGFEIKGNLATVSSKDWLPLKNLVSLLNETSESSYKESAPQLLNIDNCLNVWMFLETVSGLDNITKNMYYAYKSVGSNYYMFFIPWDLDLTWGYEYTADNALYSQYNANNVSVNIPWEPGQKIFDLNIYESQYAVSEKWKSLRATYLSDEGIAKQISTYKDLLVQSGAMARDEDRWKDSPHATDYSTITNYAIDRLEYLDAIFLK